MSITKPDRTQKYSMITGLNHLTFSVQKLTRSIEFYTSILGFKLLAKWETGAYLSAGDLWLCLSQSDTAAGDRKYDKYRDDEYTHTAFTVSDANFQMMRTTIRRSKAHEWKANSSEGFSLYFLDPDGHKLEIHSGTLQSRMAAIQNNPYENLKIYVSSTE